MVRVCVCVDRQCSIITFLSNVEHPAYQGRSVACSLRLLTFIFLLFFSLPLSLPLSLPFPSQTATFAEGEKILAFHGPQIYEGKVCDVLLVITMSFLYKNAIWGEMYLNTPQSGTAHRTAKTPHAAPVVTPY